MFHSGKKKLKEKVEKEKEASEATRVVSTAWSRLRDMELSTDFGWRFDKKLAARVNTMGSNLHIPAGGNRSIHHSKFCPFAHCPILRQSLPKASDAATI